MREVYFIKQNKEKWLGIEQVIQGKIKKNPDDLSSLYINLVNDLSFAQTYYPEKQYDCLPKSSCLLRYSRKSIKRKG